MEYLPVTDDGSLPGEIQRSWCGDEETESTPRWSTISDHPHGASGDEVWGDTAGDTSGSNHQPDLYTLPPEDISGGLSTWGGGGHGLGEVLTLPRGRTESSSSSSW